MNTSRAAAIRVGVTRGHDYGKDLFQASASQAFRRLRQGHVYLFEGSRYIHVDKRIQLKGKYQQHSSKAVNGRHVDSQAL